MYMAIEIEHPSLRFTYRYVDDCPIVALNECRTLCAQSEMSSADSSMDI